MASSAIGRVLQHFPDAKRSGSGWAARCPAHEDHNPSLSISEGDDGRVLLHCHAGCSVEAVLSAIGLKASDLFSAGERPIRPAPQPVQYVYHDEHGKPVFRVVRGPVRDGKKTFWQETPDGKGGWTKGVSRVRKVLFRLPELLAADPSAPVLIVEGEKDVLTAAGLGLVATTNPGGAGKWTAESDAAHRYSDALRGRHVVIIPDNDLVGRRHALSVLAVLRKVCASVRRVDLPGLREKGDLSDWVQAGGTAAELRAMIRTALEQKESGGEGSTGERRRRARAENTNIILTMSKPTDLGNAERLRALFGHKIRYSPALGRWFVWDRRRWVLDAEANAVRGIAARTMRATLRAAAGLDDVDGRRHLVRHALASENAGRISGAVKIAETFSSLHVDPEQLDQGVFLLNTPSGLVDLRSGDVGRHESRSLCTKLTRAPFDSEAKCPRWEQFLLEVFGEDLDVRDFVQRAVGYSLTGSTKEQVFFLLWGTGANGKSTLLASLLYALGDYGLVTSMSTWLSARPDRGNAASPDLDRLRGARFAFAAEADAGRRLSDGLVKTITGSDPIVARPLFGKPVQFVPQLKLWLATNHRPTITDDSPAMWRRVLLLPFEVQFTGKQRDDSLPEQLNSEAPGILRWAVEGAVWWHEYGLQPPETIIAAVREYQAEEDPLARFLADETAPDPEGQVPVGELLQAYSRWCEANGEEPLSTQAFGRQMTSKGFKALRTNRMRYRRGLRLLPSAVTDDAR